MQLAPIALIALIAACASKAPPPPPAPTAETKVEVCVVDPVAPGGLMTISAIHVHSSNDTVVVQSEGRVLLDSAVAGPRVLSEATWITARTPLQFQTSAGRYNWVPAGAERVMLPGKVVLLGTVRGLPIYALPGEGGPMRAEVEALAAQGIDLDKALQQRASLRRQMARVKPLYVPTSIVGCKFQLFGRKRG